MEVKDHIHLLTKNIFFKQFKILILKMIRTKKIIKTGKTKVFRFSEKTCRKTKHLQKIIL